MKTDPMKTGRRIYTLRKSLGMTQNQLADRLQVSFQAVSKWERGETLPDVALLPDLAEVLETTIDNLLTENERPGGRKPKEEFTRTATVAQMREGIECFVRMGELLGKDCIYYYAAIGGVNLRMNADMEEHLSNPEHKEICVLEAAIQNMMNGVYFEPEDLRTGFRVPRVTEMALEFAKKYGIL